MRPRVMVSSVVTGFEEMRAAARRGIEAGGGEPLLVNEDFPALSLSPRNACLDAVDSSDAYLVILGKRAGFRAPSGKPVVEEEYERALTRGVPIVAFVHEDEEREPEAQRLEQRVSDYVEGLFRTTFSGPEDLEVKVAAAIRHIADHLARPVVNPDILNSVLLAPARDQREVVLRSVFTPVRDEEVVDILELGRDTFHDSVVGLGMKVELLSAWHSKKAELSDDSLVIRQDGGDSPRRRYVRIEVTSGGMLAIDSNATDRRDSRDRLGMSGLQIVEQDVVEALTEHFRFASEFYDLVDKFRRQHAIRYNTALLGADYRRLVKVPDTGGPISMSGRGHDPVVSHPQPRQVGRATLSRPEEEIERTLELLRRRLND
jgi:hypothetical protein